VSGDDGAAASLLTLPTTLAMLQRMPGAIGYVTVVICRLGLVSVSE